MIYPPSYFHDSPNFIRMIEDTNKQGRPPDNTLIVTWDALGIFTIIPQREGFRRHKKSAKRTKYSKNLQHIFL